MHVRFAMDQAIAAGSFVAGSAAILQWLTEAFGLLGALVGAVTAVGACVLLRRRRRLIDLEIELRELELAKRRMED